MSKRTATIETALQKAIRKSELTGYQLARLSGVSDAVICRFMSGERSITVETASRLAAVLGLELREKQGKGGRRRRK